MEAAHSHDGGRRSPRGGRARYALLAAAPLVLTAGLAWPGVARAERPGAVAPATAHAVRHKATLLVKDTFSRRVSNGWGNANLGGPYTLYTGNVTTPYTGTPAGVFSVNGYAGLITLATHGANRSAYLLDVVVRDVDQTVRITFDKPATGSGEYAYLLARHLANGSEYRGKLHILPSGQITLQATRVKAGVEDSLGPEVTVPGLTYSPGNGVWMRMQVTSVGPTHALLQLKAWPDKQRQPAHWQYQFTVGEPSLAGAGAVGVRAYLGGAATNAPVTATFDGYSVSTATR